MNVTLPPDYRPSTDEPFMNTRMVEYFRQKLLNWRAELLDESNDTLQHLQESNGVEPDIADRASIDKVAIGRASSRHRLFGSLVSWQYP